MTETKQKSSGVTPREKEKLERAKQMYEKNTSNKTDWGDFCKHDFSAS